MNPRITPEIRDALKSHPDGPVQLDGDFEGKSVFLVRADDIAYIQSLIDSKIREKLAEADEDLAAGRIVPWDPEEIKARGRERFGNQSDSAS